MYRCAGDDDWVAITCRDDADWAALAGLIGSPELADDPRFATLDARRANVGRDRRPGRRVDRRHRPLRGRRPLPGRRRARRGDAALPRHHRERAPAWPGASRCRSISRPSGTILFEGPAFFGTAMAPPVEEPAPWLGEHTEEICTELLGLDPAEVQRLIEAGVLEITPLDKRPG